MLYAIVKPIAKLFIHSKFRVEVIGKENIPEHTAFIVAANHSSNYDPILLSCIIKREIHFMAKVELFRNRLCKYFFSEIHAIPIDRQKGIVIRPVRNVLKVLDRGEVFGIFPEGRRCKNGEIIQPKKGVAFFACKTNVPIVPVAIVGVKKGYRTPVKIIIGSKINVNHLNISDYSTLALHVMNKIRELQTNNSESDF
ncbi:lysophospholipid acyltransferase family protein [Virgibacillus sp. C22-A2]|uniref:1-acyl-sn-glycerol-3-phosphate acyltransferase n=1 Tax=Virgibacillus tibetensis TaxID=3042313 RepID=A0ABU6KHM5_9BACI|nr:lysophospholipid acyltransferase family protein [Virgibacillus sp. C22-A2]